MSTRSPQASSLSMSSAASMVPDNAHIPVLLVNDEPSLRVLKRSLLREAGYEVRAEPADGVVALEYLRSSDEPLIVVFNTRMPRLDGTAFLRAVARDPGLQRHAYVLNTALAGMLPNELAPLVRRLGVPVVGKPFSIEDLLGAVARAESRVLAKATAAANR